MTENFISVTEGATSFVGRGAVDLFAAMTLRRAILIYLKTGMKANRLYTPTNMRLAATRITGKRYKRGQAEMTRAVADLSAWIADSEIPVKEG